jgi:tetratricopeptide (TPR) repeat protein
MIRLLCVLFWFQLTVSPAPDVDELFRQANQHYANAEYEQAVVQYEAILEKGVENATLYFNLGNACYKLNQYAKAIVHYERARRLRPNDPDLLANLDLARLHVVDQITPIPPLMHERVWTALVRTGDISTWRLWFLIMLNVTALLLCARILAGRWWRGCFALFGASAAATLLLLMCLLSASNARHTSSQAVIMAEKVEVRGSPAGDALELFALHEGTVVTIRRRSGDWYEIELADGKVGWAPLNILEII